LTGKYLLLFYYWLLLILPLSAHPLWSEKLGLFTPFEYLGLICFYYAIIHTALRDKYRTTMFSTPAVRLSSALYLILISSALTKGTGIRLSDQALIIYTSSLLLVIITVLVVDTVQRLRWTICAFITSYAVASIYVIREWQHGHRLYSNFRPGWIVGDSNYFAATAIFAITAAFSLSQGKRPWLEKLYYSACLFLTIVAVTLCGSRGGFLGLIVAVTYLAARAKHGVRNVAVLAVLILPLGVALPMSPLHRLMQPQEDHGSTQSHLTAWKAGLRMIESNPVLGIGLGNFKPLIRQYEDPESTVTNVAHNMYVEIAAEVGIPALCVFVSILAALYRVLVRIQKTISLPDFIRGMAMAFQAGLLGFAVAGAFVSAEYQKTSWTGLAVIASLESIAGSVTRAKANPRLTVGQLVPVNLLKTSLQG
jgi:O-antigen ligase